MPKIRQEEPLSPRERAEKELASMREEELDDENEEVEEEVEEDELEMNQPKKLRPKKAAVAEVKRRFGVAQPSSMKIVDVETGEVIGDGEYIVVQALTDIIERLERIEVKIGAALN